MKHFILVACLSAALISCGNDKTKKDETTVATDTTASTTANTAVPAAPLPDSVQMKNWMAYATPGDMHKLMAKWNGTWTGKIIMWMKPGGPADTTIGTSVNKMIYGDRYQVSAHTSKMMGMPFEGQSIMGYDNAKKVFQSTWVDNMGTGIMMMEGTWDEATKTLTMSGKMTDPSSGTNKETNVREVVRIIDDSHQMFEMYGAGPDGKEFKSMEIALTKK